MHLIFEEHYSWQCVVCIPLFTYLYRTYLTYCSCYCECQAEVVYGHCKVLGVLPACSATSS